MELWTLDGPMNTVEGPWMCVGHDDATTVDVTDENQHVYVRGRGKGR